MSADAAPDLTGLTGDQISDLLLGPENFIYALIDPETDVIRYIGKSIKPWDRLRAHVNEPPSNCHRSHWLQSLKAKRLEPLMVILESVRGEWPWQEAEKYWIARGWREGWSLTNNTSGGDGVPDLPPETRARMAATWKGRKHRPETLIKLGAWKRNKASTETRAKMSASQTGRKITWTATIAEANRKITREMVPTILARLQAGEGTQVLAREFGVHRTTMSKIKMGRYLLDGQGSK